MAPKFLKSSFEFESEELVPEHDETWVTFEDVQLARTEEPDKYHLFGVDTFEGSDYGLATGLSIDEASLLLAARRKKLAREQPDAGSIRDTVEMIHPVAPAN